MYYRKFILSPTMSSNNYATPSNLSYLLVIIEEDQHHFSIVIITIFYTHFYQQSKRFNFVELLISWLKGKIFTHIYLLATLVFVQTKHFSLKKFLYKKKSKLKDHWDIERKKISKTFWWVNFILDCFLIIQSYI